MSVEGYYTCEECGCYVEHRNYHPVREVAVITACDCNRRFFFGYAAGEEYDEIDHPCGHGRFKVSLKNPKT